LQARLRHRPDEQGPRAGLERLAHQRRRRTTGPPRRRDLPALHRTGSAPGLLGHHHRHPRPIRTGIRMTDFETILLHRKDRVAVITLNRPKALNALNSQVLNDISSALDLLENDEGVGAVVLTGSDRAFAAGADIKEMQTKSYMDMFLTDHFAGWDRLV